EAAGQGGGVWSGGGGDLGAVWQTRPSRGLEDRQPMRPYDPPRTTAVCRTDAQQLWWHKPNKGTPPAVPPFDFAAVQRRAENCATSLTSRVPDRRPSPGSYAANWWDSVRVPGSNSPQHRHQPEL